MAITDFEAFNHLCRLNGITDDYYDILGKHHVACFEAKYSLLTSMGISLESDAEIHAQIEQISLRDWQTIVPSVLVYPCSETPVSTQLTLKTDQLNRPLHWQVIEETGRAHQGHWLFEACQSTQQQTFNNDHYYRFDTQLPCTETGYHRLTIKPDNAATATALLIITPETCYQPPTIKDGRKVWGINLQLYALRSKHNWGIGDYTDLQAVINILAPLGVNAIGLNPLHTLFAHLPENASPYSPSNRDFLNSVYLDIEAIDEYSRCEKAQELVNSSSFQSRLQSLRDHDLVQYTGVWQAKSTVLKLLYEQFQQDLLSNPDANKQFRQYQSDKGEDLFKFALFEALQEFFHEQQASIENWQQWPVEFHDPNSVPVKNWAESNIQAIEFHQYLQYRAEQQLAEVNRCCRQLGMQIGLYNDLAVGNQRFSSPCWAEPLDYAPGASIGAPPDDFNLLGQDWGLPPQIPQQLKDNQYRSFIQMLRANMRHAGALRIDHVMSLMRLYWIPENCPADQGTYVVYPFSDLLGILALESQRNHCLIIGEDLGTVPDEVRHQLWLKKIFSYRILFFEKDWHHGYFRPPQEYPPYSLCTSGSHDLPPLKGYWQASDLSIREKLDLYPSETVKHQQRETRAQDLYQIKVALFAEQLIDEQCLQDNSDQALTAQLFLSIQRFLARSESLLMMVQLEDLLSQSNQINIPGTIDEYPNWRHRISIDLEDWIEQSDIKNTCLALSRERSD